MNESPEFMDVKEATEFLGVKRGTLDKYVRAGRLTRYHQQAPFKTLYRRAALVKLKEVRQVKGKKTQQQE